MRDDLVRTAYQRLPYYSRAYFNFMEQSDFLELSKAQQLNEIVSKGIYLEYIIKGDYMVKLFQMENFYVNTYYHIEKNRFDSIISFDDTDKLTPFFKKNKLEIPPPKKNNN
jgi:hypothetical protein